MIYLLEQLTACVHTTTIVNVPLSTWGSSRITQLFFHIVSYEISVTLIFWSLNNIVGEYLFIPMVIIIMKLTCSVNTWYQTKLQIYIRSLHYMYLNICLPARWVLLLVKYYTDIIQFRNHFLISLQVNSLNLFYYIYQSGSTNI